MLHRLEAKTRIWKSFQGVMSFPMDHMTSSSMGRTARSIPQCNAYGILGIPTPIAHVTKKLSLPEMLLHPANLHSKQFHAARKETVTYRRPQSVPNTHHRTLRQPAPTTVIAVCRDQPFSTQSTRMCSRWTLCRGCYKMTPALVPMIPSGTFVKMSVNMKSTMRRTLSGNKHMEGMYLERALLEQSML